jgi:hypothetical protein
MLPLWHTISICLGQNWKTERMVKLIAEADVLFWSLASRDEVSRKTLFSFGQCKYKVLDLHIHYTTEVIYSINAKRL